MSQNAQIRQDGEKDSKKRVFFLFSVLKQSHACVVLKIRRIVEMWFREDKTFWVAHTMASANDNSFVIVRVLFLCKYTGFGPCKKMWEYEALSRFSYYSRLLTWTYLLLFVLATLSSEAEILFASSL